MKSNFNVNQKMKHRRESNTNFIKMAAVGALVLVTAPSIANQMHEIGNPLWLSVLMALAIDGGIIVLTVYRIKAAWLACSLASVFFLADQFPFIHDFDPNIPADWAFVALALLIAFGAPAVAASIKSEDGLLAIRGRNSKSLSLQNSKSLIF